MRCEAKMVLIRVDFPKPVCPTHDIIIRKSRYLFATFCDLPTHITLNWKPRFRSLRSIWVVMLSKPTWLLGITGLDCDDITFAAAIVSWPLLLSCCVTCQQHLLGLKEKRLESFMPKVWKRGLELGLELVGLGLERVWRGLDSGCSGLGSQPNFLAPLIPTDGHSQYISNW